MISILVLVFNEDPNIIPLSNKLLEVMDAMAEPYEVIIVNDGSTDNSFTKIKDLALQRNEVRVIDLSRNFGQTAAIMAGFDFARGDIIIPMDGDGQNDPGDIPKLIETLDRGYDVVSGWRKDRNDSRITRIWVSKIANRIISWVTGVRLKDYGCTLKAYRREVATDLQLYGEMHRFIPVYASWVGARVTEVPVQHHPRTHARSKYGLERIFKVPLDIMVIVFLGRYIAKPIYVFGSFGLFCIMISVLCGAYILFLKFVEDVSMILTPLPMLFVTTFITGITAILMGLLAEIISRTYFESQHKRAYCVKRTINFGDSEIRKDGAGREGAS